MFPKFCSKFSWLQILASWRPVYPEGGDQYGRGGRYPHHTDINITMSLSLKVSTDGKNRGHTSGGRRVCRRAAGRPVASQGPSPTGRFGGSEGAAAPVSLPLPTSSCKPYIREPAFSGEPAGWFAHPSPPPRASPQTLIGIKRCPSTTTPLFLRTDNSLEKKIAQAADGSPHVGSTRNCNPVGFPSDSKGILPNLVRFFPPRSILRIHFHSFSLFSRRV